METYTLPKCCKLHNAAEFSAVIGHKQQVNGEYIQVFIKPNDLGYARLGLIVSKKFEQRAVKRNRVKRVLRENFRLQRTCHQIKEMDWVIRLKRPVSKDKFASFVAEIRLLMTQALQCRE